MIVVPIWTAPLCLWGRLETIKRHRTLRRKPGSPLATDSSLFLPLGFGFHPGFAGMNSLLGNHTVRPYVGAVNRVTLHIVSKAINGVDSGLRSRFSTSGLSAPPRPPKTLDVKTYDDNVLARM